MVSCYAVLPDLQIRIITPHSVLVYRPYLPLSFPLPFTSSPSRLFIKLLIYLEVPASFSLQLSSPGPISEFFVLQRTILSSA